MKPPSLSTFLAAVVLSWPCLLAAQDAVPRHTLSPRGRPTNNVTVLKDRSIMPGAPGLLSQPDSPTPEVSFKALADDNRRFPPDTMGAVGTNYVVTMLNSGVLIQTRTGTPVLTNTLEEFWADTNISPAPNRVFDPRITYDPYHHRWIACAAADPASASSRVLVAVSMTGDPTGSWNRRSVLADPGGQVYADFPAVGLNVNWVVVQANRFYWDGELLDSQIYVFDKTNLYAGNFSAPTVLANTNTSWAGCEVPATTYDSTNATLYLLQDVLSSNEIRLFSITGAIGSETLNHLTSPVVYDPANGWTDYPYINWYTGEPIATNFAPQLGTTQNIQNNDAVLTSAVYRNGSLWCAHTIFLPAVTDPTRSAIQWFELKPEGWIAQRGRIEDPSGVNFYAFPSIAVNKYNDVLIGYSRFSSNQYASANYSFRPFYAGNNTTWNDAVLKAGEGQYIKFNQAEQQNRWGDYSAAVVDPVNDSDLWTIQEYAGPYVGSLTNFSGRWSTWWGKIGVPVPTNDHFAGAFTISGSEGSTNGTNLRATKEPGELSHAGISRGWSVWYQWTAPTNGLVTFNTLGTGFDSILAVYSGTSVSNLTAVASDHGSAGGASQVSFTASGDTTYRIAVDSYYGSGALTLNWLQPTAPTFILQPRSTNVIAGNPAHFTATAIGAPAPDYQWRLNGTNLSGATAASYTITNVQADLGGDYSVIASNSTGTATSQDAVLAVYASGTATLLSTAYATNEVWFTVTGVPGYLYVVQASADLSNWVSLHTNAASFNFTNYVNPNYPSRFFRAVYW